jgi:hypothetical protein
VPTTVVRALERELVNDEEFRRLCDAYAPFAPTATAHRIAVHESGHVVALLNLGIVPAVMIVRDASGSYVAADITSLKSNTSLDGLVDYFAYKLAGQAAEELEFGAAMGIEDDFLGDLLNAVMHKLTSEERQAVMQSESPMELPDAPHVQAALQLYLMGLTRSHEILAPYRKAIQELAALSEAKGSLNSNQLDAFWKSHSIET